MVLIGHAPVTREWMSGIDMACSCHEGVDEFAGTNSVSSGNIVEESFFDK